MLFKQLKRGNPYRLKILNLNEVVNTFKKYVISKVISFVSYEHANECQCTVPFRAVNVTIIIHRYSMRNGTFITAIFLYNHINIIIVIIIIIVKIRYRL